MVNYTEQLDDIFFALSNRLRRDALEQVQAGPIRLMDLAGTLQLSLPALHKHVDVLERAKLIYKKKIGRERFVMANVTNLHSAEDWIANYTKYWNSQFNSLEQYIETLEGKR